VTDEENFYLALDLAGKVVYDVGSYEGIFSLFAARAVGPDGSLAVFEPNPVSFRRTQRNLALNRFECNIILRNVALGASSRSDTMWCPANAPARATLDRDIVSKYANDGEHGDEFQVRVERLDDMIAVGLPIPRFIKIDTEGLEFEVLLGAEQTLLHYGPDLFIEMHGTTYDHWIQNRRNVQRLVMDCGYAVFDMHRRPISETDSASHLYCRGPAIHERDRAPIRREEFATNPEV
jgi:FkbM family methyltransferase